jgi:hypothetical protein
MMGAQGATGVQGPPGPQGAVLVLDGGVVTGPPGASVLTSPLPVGDSVCAFGGVMVTQLSDGGVTRVCNGERGAIGPMGPTGPAGAAGVAGPAGPQGVMGSVGPMGPAGPAGAMGPTGPAGVAGPAGATGPAGPAGVAGPAGATGATGATGPAGPAGVSGPAGATGPAGPAGAVLLLDGGVVVTAIGTGAPTFAGITTFTTTGAPVGPAGQQGRLSMNAYCNAEFPGSHICNDFEWAESTPFDPVPASGAWLEFSNTDNSRSGTGGCNGWTAGTSVGGYSRVVATQTGGTASNPATPTCGSVLPIACCE